MTRIKPSVDLFDGLPGPDELLADLFSSFAVKREVTTYMDFSKTTKVPLVEDPTRFNYYDPATDRVQYLLYEILDANEYDQYVWGSIPQLAGKTQAAIIITALRDLIDRRVNVGYGLPNLTDLDKAWTDKILPAIQESGFGHLLPEKGPGARGGRAPSIRFEDKENNQLLGRLIFLTPNAYSSTVAVALLDELDQLRKDGKPYRKGMANIFARAATAGDAAIKIAVGTIEWDEDSLLVSEIEAATHHRLAPKCPHCNDHFLFEFDNFTYEKGGGEELAETSARIACGACGVLLNEEERKEAISSAIFLSKDQEWQPGIGIKGKTQGKNFSLRTHALDCTRGDMGKIAVKHYQAQVAIDEYDDHERMRDFAHYTKCETYTDDLDADLAGLTQELTRAELYRKSQKGTHELGALPDGFTYAIGSIDIQKTRCYHILSGYSEDQCADIEHGYTEFCEYKEEPTDAAILKGLDDAIDEMLETCERCDVNLPAVAVDFGYRLELLKHWLKQSPHSDIIMPVRGISDMQADKMGKGAIFQKEKHDLPGTYYLRRQTGGWTLLFADTEPLREKVQGAYRLPIDASGSNLLPSGLKKNDFLFKHLCAMRITYDKSGRKKWEKITSREDFLDCKTYQAAVNVRLREAVKLTYDFGKGEESEDVPATEEQLEAIAVPADSKPSNIEYYF